jgi:hypothetical protein
MAISLPFNGCGAMGRYNKHVGLHAGMIQADRWQLNQGAVVRFWSGVTADCLVINVSRFGFRVQVPKPLIANQTIWLELEGCEPLHSKVIWSEADFAGCQFVMPLGDAVYGDIILFSSGPDRLGDEIYI